MSTVDLAETKKWIIHLLSGNGFGTDYSETEVESWASELHAMLDWRVLGGVIPGPIPVEWVEVGDTIQDHGVTGIITRAKRSGGIVHLSIDSGHVSFAKVAQQDFVHVLEAGGVRDE